ncbi:MAG: hypothetical protein WC120_05205 [Parcubacteria group bacterium]|jgi:hypothetical protein
MSDPKKPDPDVAWIAGIVGQVNKCGGMTDLRFKTIEKLIRVAGEGIASRALVGSLEDEREELCSACRILERERDEAQRDLAAARAEIERLHKQRVDLIEALEVYQRGGGVAIRASGDIPVTKATYGDDESKTGEV